ncbi:MAG: response regulator [bacterium]|nr:response regulator [bacterium]
MKSNYGKLGYLSRGRQFSPGFVLFFLLSLPLFIWPLEFEHISLKQGLSHGSVYAIAQDPQGFMWFGTEDGLNKYDGHNITVFYHEASNGNSISSGNVGYIVVEPSGVMWLGTWDGGLNRYDPKTDTFKHYLHNPGDPKSLTGNSIMTICQDKDQRIWVGTDSGLDRWDPETDGFIHYRYEPGNLPGLSGKRIRSVCQDREGILWVGTRDGGLNRLNLETGAVKTYRHDPRNPLSISSDYVSQVFEDSNGTLWVGTYDQGLNRFDRTRRTFDRFKHDPRDSYSLSHNRVELIYEDRAKVLWVGTRGGGINKLDLKPAKFKSYGHIPHQPHSLPYPVVLAIAEAGEKDTLWIGTLNGLNRFDRSSGRFVAFTHKPGDPRSISSNYVHAIYEEPEEPGTSRPPVLWIGTEEGLNKFYPDTGIFKPYTPDHGLPAKRITGILSDEKENLWLATSRGLSRFNPGTEESRNYDTWDGLPDTGFSRNASLKTAGGRMFFGCLTGVVTFLPSEVRDNPFVPPVVLTSFKQFNRDVPFSKPLWDIDAVKLSYRRNFISFEFSALDYTDWSKNRYRYKMEGIDPDWIDSGTRHFAGYPNLPPGEYVFHVRGSNNDGLWNEKGVTLNVIITPPFWQLAWFQVSVILLIVFFILAGFRLRVRRIKKRNIQLEQTNTRLEDQIRKREQAEKELLESRERLHSVIQQASMILWTLDKEGIFTFSDGRGLEQLGLKPGEVVGQSVFDLYAGFPEILDAARNALTGERVSYITTLGDLTFNVFYSPLKNAQGELTGTIGLAVDETERKQMEEEKKNLEEQLRHVKKLETIGTLAGGIAHDFNNMLGPILGYTEMALAEIPPGNVTTQWLNSVVEAAYRARDLVRQILLFGRREKQEYKPALVRVIAEEALKLIRASFPATIRIQRDIASDCPPVPADSTQLHQVFMNLCTNAKHAMESRGGLLDIRLRPVDIDAGFVRSHPNLNAGRHLCFSVRDTGHGMDPETQSRLFDPFYTTKKPGEGTGMGLSTAHGIVTAHGGAITVKSETGNGAEFNVYLPVADVSLPLSQTQNGTEAPPKGKEHILLVDDEESMVIMGRAMLEQLGYRVTAFTESPNALEVVREGGEQFDLVITDKTMPHLTGTQLSEKINALHPSLPILLVSGFSERINREILKQSGISAYLPKPFNPRDLGLAIRALLD